MNPYDRLRRPDFQAQQGVSMPWLEAPPMMMPEEEEGIGQNTGVMAGALKQRLMGTNPTAPKPTLPAPDINIAEPPIPTPNIPSFSNALPVDKLGASMAGGLKGGAGGGMKSL